MMKSHSPKKHGIEALFPIVLFFVLTVFALLVITLAAKIYENTAESSYRNHQSRIALSYISEKIHQNKDCQISIEKLSSTTTLALRSEHQDTFYKTYIYYYEGSLRELFVKEGIDFSLSDGKEILKLSDFSMKEADSGLLYFSCIDANGQTTNSYVSIAD